MERPSILPPLLSALALLLAASTAGSLGAGEIVGPQRVLGPATVEDGHLHLPAGSVVVLGEGDVVELRLNMEGADLDVVRGPPTAPWAFAHFDPDGLGLFSGDGEALSRGTPQQWRTGAPRSLRVRCRPPLLIEVDGRSLDVANGGAASCQAGPLSVRANSELVLLSASVDGHPVPFALTRLSWGPAAAVALGLGLLAALLGQSALLPLLLSPLALLAPRLGLPPEAALLLLGGSGAANVVLSAEGWRRPLAGALCVAALLAAGAAVIAAQRPMGLDGGESALVAQALSRHVSAETFTQKVDDAVAYYRPKLDAIPDDGRPLVVALGSSSTGGNTHGRFWPEVVGELVPEARVLRMAWGGMTTWHMRKLLDALDLRPDVCVLYMGHNDLTPTSPGASLARIERGEHGDGGFVAPVPVAEARDNLIAISQRCGQLIAMDERSMESEALLASYKQMLQAHPGVVYVDGAAALAALPDHVAMMDPVHPSPKGHQVLGQRVAEALRPLVGEAR